MNQNGSIVWIDSSVLPRADVEFCDAVSVRHAVWTHVSGEKKIKKKKSCTLETLPPIVLVLLYIHIDYFGGVLAQGFQVFNLLNTRGNEKW